jgi:hypothetical protein
MTLAEAREHIGATVIYHGHAWDDHCRTEAGVITSTGQRYVFVRYGDDKGSKATDPALLVLDDEPGGGAA